MSKTKKNATEGLNGALARVIRGESTMRGITRDELASRSGVPFDSLKNYLSASPARARVMDIEVVAAIAAGLGIPLHTLVAKAVELEQDPTMRQHDERLSS